MAKTRSQTGNITVKKEEEDDKPSLLLNRVRNTRSNGRISKRRPLVTNNGSLPAQQVKVEEDTDTKALLKSSSEYSKCRPKARITQAQINQLIHYIVKDNMSVTKAARKVKICADTGLRYYHLYKNDPEKKMPLPRNQTMYPRKYYTQEQIGNVIKYIDTDKMTIKEASAKADMTYQSAYHYYNRYLKDPNHAIPVHQFHQMYTQEQKDEFIGYIINDKMNITTASKKAKINYDTARDYYHNYFKIQNPDIPAPSHITTHKRSTQEQLNKAMGYIINDKMSIGAASRKANVCDETTRIRYRKYLKDNGMKVPVKRVSKHHTHGQKSELIGYIFGDKMSIKAASKKANMSCHYGTKYYRQYLKDHNLTMPHSNSIPQDKVNQLIGYIVDDKMSITAASRKANMSQTTGYRHYRLYLKDQKRGVPT